MACSDTFFRPDLRASIDSRRLTGNVNQLRGLTPADNKFCAVVKANAYGHGIREVANLLKDEDVDFFAVASIFEAVYIKPLISRQNILVFEPLNICTPAKYIDFACRNDVHWAICSLEAAKRASQLAGGKKLKLHINIETGMGRLGLEPTQAEELINFIADSPKLELAGIYTHFATADEDDLSFAYEQLENFKRFIKTNQNFLDENVIRHAANSAACIKIPESHFDMVRCGISMYGYFSRSQRHAPVNLSPVMKLEAPIVHIKKLPAGRSVSYGRSYFTKRETATAIIPSGYADGYSRLYSNNAFVRIGEKFAPVIGRVCMDQIMADVTDIPEAKVGQFAVIIDNDQSSPAGAYCLANASNTICYEILISVHEHVRRTVI
ncbi:Alanine racemase 1 [Sedimentisphaera cyanobacteriorum]|uniref:Alanine racemase n=1 Tax=Sedimentisphaera cyanobacteriorum TaxID=1940790 RepID=A0A1Q2HQF5_9BACT|nr:alanine racemase [Sedimentisphaera cyanobacteriorum]AQQ09465.1 Alanine racemase 1 [Sedimentisphaera cyanobacteriorum]